MLYTTKNLFLVWQILGFRLGFWNISIIEMLQVLSSKYLWFIDPMKPPLCYPCSGFRYVLVIGSEEL